MTPKYYDDSDFIALFGNAAPPTITPQATQAILDMAAYAPPTAHEFNFFMFSINRWVLSGAVTAALILGILSSPYLTTTEQPFLKQSVQYYIFADRGGW